MCKSKDCYLGLYIVLLTCTPDTVQKMKFSIKDFFRKCDHIRSFLRIWSHLLKKSLMENFSFCIVSLFGSDDQKMESTTV